MSQVIFLKAEDRLKETLKKEFVGLFNKGDKIAVKLHMGEPGSKTYLKPEFAKIAIDVLKELGVEPFIFDSPVAYNSPRGNIKGHQGLAKKHGFDKLCKVVISDEGVQVKGKNIVYDVCKPLLEADGILVISHVKGHICCGFGGAIKNLGMGGQTKNGKNRIHDSGKPEYFEGCTLCEMCAKHCPTDNIRYRRKGEPRPYFDKNWCCGCSNCSRFCPEKAIKPKKDYFDFLIAESAHSVIKDKKVYFINFVKDITKFCDCLSDSGPILADDVGILLSKDIVAIEKASFDLICEKAGKDVFEEEHHKSPLVHIKEAEKLGMGSMDYELA